MLLINSCKQWSGDCKQSIVSINYGEIGVFSKFINGNGEKRMEFGISDCAYVVVIGGVSVYDRQPTEITR